MFVLLSKGEGQSPAFQKSGMRSNQHDDDDDGWCIDATLSPTTIDIAESIPAQGKAELDAESPVLIKNLTINSKNYVVYLATTKSNQLLISFYESGTNELKASKYFGQSVPLQAADFSLTSDGGLMILSRVTVMGSFNRIATIKLSKEELVEIVE